MPELMAKVAKDTRWRPRLVLLLAAVVSLASFQGASALTINASWVVGTGPGQFTAEQAKILKAALDRWAYLLPCNDGMTISITFTSASLAGRTLGYTNTMFNDDGSVASATIQLDSADLSWGMAVPEAGYQDALSVAQHELAHGLGWLDLRWDGGGSRYSQSVANVTGNSFYDMNGDGVYNAGDFDLNDSDPSHAADYTDLMGPDPISGTRQTASLAHAKVLGDAYGYCVIPEPVTLLGVFLGVTCLAGYIRRRRGFGGQVRRRKSAA